MRCPHCKDRVLRKSGDRVTLRTHGPIEFIDGECRTQCHWCKGQITLPLAVSDDIEDMPAERFVITVPDTP
jgi:hypothetical protein